MLDTRNRAEPYRDLAQECRRLAASAPSSQIKKRYWRMAQDYLWLADLKEQAHTYRTPATVEEDAVWAASGFSAPWRIVEIPHGFAVEDAAGQQLAAFYGLAEPDTARQTDFLTIDEARQMAVDFAKLPAVAGLRLAEMRTTVPKFTSFEPDEWTPAPVSPRPSNPLSNRTKFLIAIALAVLPAGYFTFRNFDRLVDVALVPQAATDIPPVESSSAREAEAPSAKPARTTVEGRAEPEVQTAPLPAPPDTKPTEGDIQAGLPQTLPERARQSSAASRDDSTCLPSAAAVRQNYPGAWPAWTLRAPGHENTRCWYAATPTTKPTGTTVEGRAEPEVRTAPLPAPSDKPTERDIQAGPPQTLPERGRQSSAVSRDDSTCLPSAEAVRQNYPGGWPAWTLRAPGHENTRCWYAATPATTHRH
jgi:hypothetical protein